MGRDHFSRNMNKRKQKIKHDHALQENKVNYARTI